jgi:hypothetical protein
MRPTSLILFLVSACFALGQTAKVSFSIQEPESMKDLTGKVIRNYQLVGVEVCSVDGKPFSGGRLYQVASPYYTWQAPNLAAARIANAVQHNYRYYLLEGGKVLTMAATVLTASGAIHASQGVISGLAQSHQIMDEVGRFIEGQIPNPAPLYQLLVKDETVYNFSGPGDCHSGIIVIRSKKTNMNQGPVNVP